MHIYRPSRLSVMPRLAGQVGSPRPSREKHMNTESTSSLVRGDDLSRFDVQVVLQGFLASYSSNTLLAYHQDLH